MAALSFDIDTGVPHHDTTSISVYGDYKLADPPFPITYGHSTDKRPDLKQFLVSMRCVGGNIPIFGKTEDGNGSDKTMNNREEFRVSERSGNRQQHFSEKKRRESKFSV